jgi:hypothetical protein
MLEPPKPTQDPDSWLIFWVWLIIVGGALFGFGAYVVWYMVRGD